VPVQSLAAPGDRAAALRGPSDSPRWSPLLVSLTAVVFLLERQVPANPVRALLGTSASGAAVAAKRHELYLDRSLPTQFWHFIVGAVQGDLGMSLHTRRPVMSDIKSFLPATVELALTAAVIAACSASLWGLLTARGRGVRPGSDCSRLRRCLSSCSVWCSCWSSTASCTGCRAGPAVL